MKIRQEQIEKACRFILEHLKEKRLLILKAPENKVYQKLVETFVHNVQQEEVIDQEAKKILEETLEKSPSQELDRQKLYLLIKRKLAKDKGFIL